MERQGKGMDLFHAGMSLVMTDVEGSTSLWEWNSHIMNSALSLHDYTLRSLLPKYFGYEVSILTVNAVTQQLNLAMKSKP